VNYLPRLASNCIIPILAFQVAKITGMAAS
jgi:hypothetical protein